MLLGVWYWFVPPSGSFQIRAPGELFGIAGFMIFAAVIITIGERARRTQAKLNAAHGEMEGAVKLRTVELAQANEKLRELTTRLLQTQDAERRRFARDLHDSVGQLLAVISMNLGSLDQRALNPSNAALVNDSLNLIDEASQEIRTISHLLHPPLLDEAGLAAALPVYVQGFSQRSKIEVDLQIPPDLPRFSQDVELTIFRVVQESLTNTHKHANARHVTIRVEHSPENVAVKIVDDGKGLPKNYSRGVGLSGMQERVRQLHGTCEIFSGSGTTVAVTLPITEPAKAAAASTD